MSTPASGESWRQVLPISKAEGDRLVKSRADLVRFLADRFTQAFGATVEETSVETFPDGLSVTLVADVKPHPKYNVWGHAISRSFADAGAELPVSVIVRESKELLEPPGTR
jgi:hypothetical protein